MSTSWSSVGNDRADEVSSGGARLGKKAVAVRKARSVVTVDWQRSEPGEMIDELSGE